MKIPSGNLALKHPSRSSRRYTKRNEKQGLKSAMNKFHLVLDLARNPDLSLSKSDEILNLVFETISRTLINGSRIEVRGFGSFEVKEYRDYTGRNPKTGEKIAVSKKKLPFFKVGKELREKVNERA